ncbi:hypothetical protein K438DRAFT_1764272 [Mycena galopus ATCC 62051]|nr:hypothetical protein K438DRAFT_1764272 [Mycena galopus ATCC 62051]
MAQWIARQNPPLPANDTAKRETIKIYLPSSLPAADCEGVCAPGLAPQEERLRKAQAEDALRHLRRGLHTRTFAHKFKRQHLSDQNIYTKSRIREAAARYRAARAALLALRGPREWECSLQILKKEDVRGMNERAMNEEEKEENKKARLLAGLSGDGNDELDILREVPEPTVLFNLEMGEGKRLLSWIWYSTPQRGSDETRDGSLHPDIRVEWMKARARADRWREELVLVEEEMRRVLEFCVWKAKWWRKKAEPGEDCDGVTVSAELAEGLAAYALEQAAREEAWLAAWGAKWEKVDRGFLVWCTLECTPPASSGFFEVSASAHCNVHYGTIRDREF